MNALLQTYSLLNAVLQADTLLSLAQTVAWLDPITFADEDDVFSGDEDGTLLHALHIIRDCFPDVYATAVEALRSGAEYAALDTLICGELTRQGIPADNLETLGFGIPLPAYGINLSDPDTYTEHPDPLPVLDVFGIRPEPNAYHVEIPDCAYTAGRIIASDLVEHPAYSPLGWLIGWVFGCTGNSSVDWDDEMMSSTEPLAWEPDNVAFAQELIAEAEEIMEHVRDGLALLKSSPPLMESLADNVKRVYRAIKRHKGNRGDPTVRLEWLEVFLDTYSDTVPSNPSGNSSKSDASISKKAGFDHTQPS